VITRVFEDSDGTYGYRRIAAQLTRSGIAADAELVRMLMRELGLVPCQPQPWRPATTQQGPSRPGEPRFHHGRARPEDGRIRVVDRRRDGGATV
jgi:HTH-like domain